MAGVRSIQSVSLQQGGFLRVLLMLARVDAMRRDGTLRDTVVHRPHAGEWPETKAQLDCLLNKPSPSPPPTP
jgi:hypothetical protein